MADPDELLAWDDVAAALDLNIFGDLSNRTEGNALFAPLDLDAISAPDLKQARASTREPTRLGSAPVASARRHCRGKGKGNKGKNLKNKTDNPNFENAPHIVDGDVDRFPRLKNVTPLQENNESHGAAYERAGPSGGFDDQDHTVENDPFHPRRGPNSEVMPAPRGFSDCPTTVPSGWRNYPPFPGVHFGYLIPPVPKDGGRKKSAARNGGGAGMNFWSSDNFSPMYNQYAHPGQFTGRPPWFRNMPYPMQPMYPQMMFAQDQFMPQRGPVKPKFRTAPFPENYGPGASAQREIPKRVFEVPPPRNDKPVSVKTPAIDGRALLATSFKNDNEPPSAPISIGIPQNPAGLKGPAHRNRLRRPVPDLELLKRTLESIKKGNTIRKQKQSKKTKAQQSRPGSKQREKTNIERPPCGSNEQQTNPSEYHENQRHPRLAAHGGIQKLMLPKSNLGPTHGTSKLNRNWRSAREAADFQERHWMQSRKGNSQTDWRGNEVPKIWQGAFRNIGSGQRGGSTPENRHGETGELENRRSVFERLGRRRTQEANEEHVSHPGYSNTGSHYRVGG